MCNISASDIIGQNEKLDPVKFSTTNYLNCRLDKNETTKTLKIRLLPFSPQGGTPFYMIHTHTVRVPRELSKDSGWKSYTCLRKTSGLNPELGNKCPFCEIHDEVNKILKTDLSDTDKKKYSDIEYQMRPKDTWIVRCIERGKENDGVKFWRFNASRKKDGVYDTLFNLFKQRMIESGEEKYNIFDLENGKDLIITLSKDANNKVAINIVDAGRESPLSTDKAQAQAWINDPKKWTEVYSIKPYDYLSIVSTGEIPYFDKENGIWIVKPKDENEGNENEDKKNINAYSNFDSEDLGESINLNVNDNDDDIGF